jgi:hypothetical protein
MREHHAYLALGCVLLGMLSLRQPTLCAPFLRSQILTRIDLARRSAAKCNRSNRCCEYKPEVTLPGPPSAHRRISSYIRLEHL